MLQACADLRWRTSSRSIRPPARCIEELRVSVSPLHPSALPPPPRARGSRGAGGGGGGGAAAAHTAGAGHAHAPRHAPATVRFVMRTWLGASHGGGARASLRSWMLTRTESWAPKRPCATVAAGVAARHPPAAIARAITAQAFERSIQRRGATPYGTAATDAFDMVTTVYSGGKPDDIAVLVVHVSD